jgi:hypothetical protein
MLLGKLIQSPGGATISCDIYNAFGPIHSERSRSVEPCQAEKCKSFVSFKENASLPYTTVHGHLLSFPFLYRFCVI